MFIKIPQLIANPGLEQLLIKHKQEVVRSKGHVNNGYVVIDDLSYEVTDPELITFIKLKYNVC